MAEFFEMGGYAFFVWTSYLVVLILFLYQYFSSIVQHRKLFSKLGHEIRSSKTTARKK
jgi:heme exporter protein CcmD